MSVLTQKPDGQIESLTFLVQDVVDMSRLQARLLEEQDEAALAVSDRLFLASEERYQRLLPYLVKEAVYTITSDLSLEEREYARDLVRACIHDRTIEEKHGAYCLSLVGMDEQEPLPFEIQAAPHVPAFSQVA